MDHVITLAVVGFAGVLVFSAAAVALDTGTDRGARRASVCASIAAGSFVLALAYMIVGGLQPR